MNDLLELARRPFLELGPSQQMAMVLLILGSCFLAFHSVSFAARRLRERRREQRSLLANLIEVSCEGSATHGRSFPGNCVDISTLGLQMRLPEPIGVGARVSFRLLGLGLSGMATVRHCSRSDSGHVIRVALERAPTGLEPEGSRPQYSRGSAEDRRCP